MLQGYRTIVFNLVMALAAVVRALWPDCPIDEDISKYFDAVWMIVILIGNLVLRKFTKGPIGVKDPECK